MERVTLKKKRAVAWMGDSREVVKGFPRDIRQRFGRDLFRMELGLEPVHYRPMPSLGLGVYELREQDERAWYRVVYYVRVKDLIYVLHAFEKESGKTSKQDRRTVELRLKQVPKR
jgi:phage-related protein